MTDDEAVEIVRRKLGIVRKPPPELLLAVKVRTLLNVVAHSFEAVGTATGWGLLLGSTGLPLVSEMDKIKRQLTCELNDLTTTTHPG